MAVRQQKSRNETRHDDVDGQLKKPKKSTTRTALELLKW
jgi:hypothetical protein